MDCVSKYCFWVRINICYDFIKIFKDNIKNIKCDLLLLINEDIYLILMLFLKSRVIFFYNNIKVRYVKKFVNMNSIGF